MGNLHFENCFWPPLHPVRGNSSVAQPFDYRTGYSILRDKMEKGRSELLDVFTFFNDFVSLQKIHGQQLEDLMTKDRYASRRSFGIDEGGSLTRAYDSTRSEMGILANHHKQISSNLDMMVINPMMMFTREYEKTLSEGSLMVERHLSQFESYLVDYERDRHYYVDKCHEADRAEDALPPEVKKHLLRSQIHRRHNHRHENGMKNPLAAINHHHNNVIATIGPLQLTEEELESMFAQMYEQIPVQTVHTLLSKYSGVLGSDITDWLITMLDGKIADIDIAEYTAQEMMEKEYILAVNGNAEEFDSSSDSLYQWSKKFMDICEPLHKKLRGEADKAEDACRVSAAYADFSRRTLEEILMSYFANMEHLELERLKIIQNALESMSLLLYNTSSFSKIQHERFVKIMSDTSPRQDLIHLVKNNLTGWYWPRPIIFTDYYEIAKDDSLFGTPLDRMLIEKGNKIPQFVLKIISAISKETVNMTKDEICEFWLEPMDLGQIHSLRDDIRMKQLRIYDLHTIIGLLKLFLLEIPEPVSTFEIYDTTKKLYASLRVQLSNISTVYFHTLSFLMQSLSKLFEGNEEFHGERMQEFVQNMAWYFFRPRNPSKITTGERHTCLILADMVLRYEQVFAPMHRLSSVSLGEYKSEGTLTSESEEEEEEEKIHHHHQHAHRVHGLDPENEANWGRFSDDDSDVQVVWDSD